MNEKISDKNGILRSQKKHQLPQYIRSSIFGIIFVMSSNTYSANNSTIANENTSQNTQIKAGIIFNQKNILPLLDRIKAKSLELQKYTSDKNAVQLGKNIHTLIEMYTPLFVDGTFNPEIHSILGEKIYEILENIYTPNANRFHYEIDDNESKQKLEIIHQISNEFIEILFRTYTSKLNTSHFIRDTNKKIFQPNQIAFQSMKEKLKTYENPNWPLVKKYTHLLQNELEILKQDIESGKTCLYTYKKTLNDRKIMIYKLSRDISHDYSKGLVSPEEQKIIFSFGGINSEMIDLIENIEKSYNQTMIELYRSKK